MAHQLPNAQQARSSAAKILVFDAGLDDELVEIVKLGAIHQLLARYDALVAALGAGPFDPRWVHFYRTLPGDELAGERLEFLLAAPGQRVLYSLWVPLDEGLETARTLRWRLGPPPSVWPGWHEVGPGWTLSELADMPIPVGDMEVLIDPQLLASDRVAEAFRTAGPGILAGSQRPLHLPPAASREPRPQHYRFAHQRLRGAFHDPHECVGAFHSPDRDKIVRALWDEVTAECAAERLPTPLTADGIRVHTARIQRYFTAIIEMPPPTGHGEAYFVALVLRHIGVGGEGAGISEVPALAYYTLELGEDRSGAHCTYLCEWKADGSRANYGRGPAPVLEDFVEAVAALVRESAFLKMPMPVELMRG